MLPLQHLDNQLGEHSIIKDMLVCVALNHSQQLAEMQTHFTQAPYRKLPLQPVLYFKPRNTWGSDKAIIPWPQLGPGLVVGASLE